MTVKELVEYLKTLDADLILVHPVVRAYDETGDYTVEEINSAYFERQGKYLVVCDSLSLNYPESEISELIKSHIEYDGD